MKELLINALDNDWRSAVEIADRAGVSRKSAIKVLLRCGFEEKDIEVTEHHWVDERWRSRMKRLYRKPTLTAEEQAKLYNSVLGFKAPPQIAAGHIHRLGK